MCGLRVLMGKGTGMHWLLQRGLMRCNTVVGLLKLHINVSVWKFAIENRINVREVQRSGVLIAYRAFLRLLLHPAGPGTTLL